ncbi:MAG TPA: META domain-containing protein [Sphingomicrobium sp.]|nr:META domain-containing protein [Sphingomicrobium sp.]
MAAEGSRLRRAAGLGAALATLQNCAPVPINAPIAVPVAHSLSTDDIVQVPVAPGSWRVFSVNGHETPAIGDYSIRFADGRVSARFGCNMMGGSYRVEGGLILIGDLAQTLMGCPEPAETFERTGREILSRPMHIGMEPTTGGPLVFNGAGRINLVPIVTGTRR